MLRPGNVLAKGTAGAQTRRSLRSSPFALSDFEAFSTKAELLQLKLTPIICLMNFVHKKVGNLKN